MTLDSLHLSDFRQYKKHNFSFSPSVTIVVGDNASGKSNMIEAIFLLAVGKSFKAESDREMIAFGREVGRINAKITQLSLPDRQAGNYPINTNPPAGGPINEKMQSDQIELEILLTTGQVMGEKTQIKKYSVNGVGKRMVDFVGNLRVVLFWPEDLELVTDSPSLRRRYLDFVLTQVDREYRRCLISYEKGLRQRNKLLEAIRDVGAHRHQLIFWDQLLIKNGEYITGKREEYIDFVNNPELRTKSLEIKTGNIFYRIEYDKSIISRMRLDQYSEEEVAAGVTLVGPHRDDFTFRIRNYESGIRNEEYRNLSQYGSRGEQRLGILWLKLGELAYIEQAIGEKPVLLLDDILSELDHEHRKIIFEVIDRQQTIITTTDIHFLPKSLKSLKIIEL